MSELLTKRQFTDELSNGSDEADLKRQETAARKNSSKPGRKPIDTEPKNKRTAQNRAAQRAFRERKERKMKDLEDKIDTLENEKKSANTEADFLRLQVRMLMSELSKHRDTSDIKLPTNLNLTNSSARSNSTPSSDGSSSIFSLTESDETNKSSTNLEQELNLNKDSQFSFEFPWGNKNKSPSVNSYIPALASDASTASTNSSAQSSPFELYNTEEQRDLPLFNQIKKKSISDNGLDFQFDENFDEGISEFCTELNSACGTKEDPIPKSKSSTPVSTPVEQKKVLPPRSTKLNSIKEDPLSFLNDSLNSQLGTFDPTLAFVQDPNDGFEDLFDGPEQLQIDPIASLTTEESLYDPFGMYSNSRFSPIVETHTQPSSISSSIQPGKYSNTKTPLEDLGLTGDDALEDINDEVVPSREDRFMKCTEIWDRITSHPKYSDIDIDGLCSELRSKAKCSDKGVVIDFADLNNVIQNSLPRKKN